MQNQEFENRKQLLCRRDVVYVCEDRRTSETLIVLNDRYIFCYRGSADQKMRRYGKAKINMETYFVAATGARCSSLLCWPSSLEREQRKRASMESGKKQFIFPKFPEVLIC